MAEPPDDAVGVWAEQGAVALHIHFDDMAWPVPDSELEWRLRYGKPTRNDLLVAASILSAYQALILRKPLKRGAEIVSKMRRILNHSTK